MRFNIIGPQPFFAVRGNRIGIIIGIISRIGRLLAAVAVQ